MYSNSIELFVKLWPFVLFAVVGGLITEAVDEITSRGTAMTFVSVLIWAYLALGTVMTAWVLSMAHKSAEGIETIDTLVF